jgi:hypothetical protein
MSTVDATEKAPRKRRVREAAGPTFITKVQMAREMGLKEPRTIDAWVAAGTWPPAHSRPSERVALWRRFHWLAYVETGRWPAEAFPRRDG